MKRGAGVAVRPEGDLPFTRLDPGVPMADRSAHLEAVPMNGSPGEADAARVRFLEERVRRLEDVVATLQDTRQMEERVLETLAARVAPPRASGTREKAALIIDAGRQLLPAAVDALREGAETAEAQARLQAKAPSRAPWLLFDLYAEARALFRMYVDPRYRMGWQGRLLPLILLGAIISSWFWLPGTAILGAIPGFGGLLTTIYMKAVDLVLAFVLCKVVLREVRRYREVSPDLPAALRL